LLGLNDHEIATEGATVRRLNDLNPAVLQLVIRPDGGTAAPVLRSLLSSGRYEFATATVKTNDKLRVGSPFQAHFYFVKKDVALSRQLLDSLRGMQDVKRLPAAVTRQVLRNMDYEHGRRHS
jgi:hypothetical protein